ncbi:GDP-mannose pyrophosphatase [Brachionus plicatilis]|uniref:Uridine diphosphate glucose pyrophosphatase NUDT14 n=1 Tax=Brachionus plicatilis TaxID=10195 RepID=A0A3M7QE66_BRAPC|nr:GDP-mannose pyrophosphatase [Brachionus plicatilis]
MTEDNKTVESSNHDIHSFEVSELTTSRYINPYRLQFRHNSQKRVWDGIISFPSVSCILYHTVRESVILVRQFRPVVYVNQLLESQASNQNDETKVFNKINGIDWSKAHPNEAFTYELCAGICDKNKSLEETIKEEIMEECGFDVDIKNVHKVRSFRVGVGLIGCLHTIFYAEVDESMKIGSGGGNQYEGEFIDLYEIHKDSIREFLDDESKQKPPGLLYGLMWFLYEREHFLLKSKK